MISVIIAGGSGSRLWPISTPEHPKHLLSLTGKKALIQYAYDRARAMSDEVIIITESSHENHVRRLLPDIKIDNFIIEPARRGTASCIVAALDRISRSHDRSETVAFMHADHYIRDIKGFKHSFEVASKISDDSKSIVLIGVEPSYPSTGFGYIQKGKKYGDGPLSFNVKLFKEKPDHKTAQKYLKSGEYLWNCGFFLGSLDTFLTSMEQCAPDLFEYYKKLKKAKTKSAFIKTYTAFKNVAIDYALIEKVEDLLVVPATFDWLDIGSFADLHKAVISDENRNYIKGDNIEVSGVENSIVRNDQQKPVAVIGLDNVVVINTDNGLLVARKDLSQNVGVISKKFVKQ